MLSRFSVSNYKNFPGTIELSLDEIGKYQFSQECLTSDQRHLSKILLYGRNGTGKTNLGLALKNIEHIFSGNKDKKPGLSNADTDSDQIRFRYTFSFGQDQSVYSYIIDEEENILSEELIINGDSVFHSENGEVGFIDKEKLGIPTLNMQQYETGARNREDRIPLIRWIAVNSSLEENSPILQIRKFAEGFKYIKISDRLIPYGSLIEQNARRIGKLEASELQEFLKEMGFPCQLGAHEEADGKMQLYFEYKTPVKFYQNASSGILSLAELFWYLKDVTDDTSVLYLDEFDAFLHYEMAESLFHYMNRTYPDLQILYTTHNTELLSNRNSRPDAIQILSEDHRLTPLFKATRREIREGHNLEKMYRSGEFQDYE